MRDDRETNVFILVCVMIAAIEASKCPETRKPHVASCTIFYNCINLPESGYVWVPAKCSEGLVFQPYLRMCVLPGDAWDCDDSDTDKMKPNHNSGSQAPSNPLATSYEKYTQDFTPSLEDSTIESYHTIDDAPGLGNHLPLATAYPLIQINNEKNDKIATIEDSVSLDKQQGMENYVNEFFASQHRLRTRLDSVTSGSNVKNSKFTWLREIIDRILLYEDYGYTRSSCQSKKTNRRDVLDRNVFNYLLESYVLGTRNPKREKSKKKKSQPTTSSTWTGRIVEYDDLMTTTPINVHRRNAIDELINGQESENNVVIIEGNLGEKEYVTIDKYRALSSQLKLRVLGVLPCVRGVRLPNSTDCTRYYTCDPETAHITEFTCPSRTAFNDYNRVCDHQRFKACKRRHEEQFVATTHRVHSTVKTPLSDIVETTKKYEPCPSTGKFGDSMSDKSYYVCYSSQANPSKIESLRMTCPNDLIFCQDRRVCSTRKRCYDY